MDKKALATLMSFNKVAQNADDQGSSTYDKATLGLAAAAGVAPFAGLIGQKKLVNDPNYNSNIREVDLKKLESLARPGDVVISSRPKWEGFKATQTPFSASEFFHATPVGWKDGKRSKVIDAGDFAASGVTVDAKNIKRHAKFLSQHMDDHGYHDMVLVRPDKKVTPSQAAKFQKALAERANAEYSVSRGTKSWLKDLMIPKVLKGTCKAPKNYKAEQMCSTLPGEALTEAGIMSPIKGKNMADMLPSDFLREGSGFKAVATRRIQQNGLGPMGIKYAPMLSRLGLGAALGGATYGVTQAPVETTAIAAGLAAPALVQHLIDKKYLNTEGIIKNKLHQRDVNHLAYSYPGLHDYIKRKLGFTTTGSKALNAIQGKNLIRRSLPLGLGVGAGTYLLGNAIRNSIKGKTDEKNS